MRRLVLLTSTIIFFDVAFYAAISPLLPKYIDDLGLSDTQAGILTASYAVGTLLNSLPAGFVVTRLGPRRTVMAGLAILTVSTVGFGFATSFGVLVAARFVQGISGAFTWTGALTWLTTTAPESQRGTVIGTALGTGVAGALLGPPLGALASGIGTAPVFATVAAITLVLIFAAARLPDSTERAEGGVGETLRMFTRRPVLGGIGMIAVPSLMFGAIAVLVPLRINDLGGGAVLIAAGFTLGAGLEAGLSPIVGRYSDREGRTRPYVVGLCVAAAGVLLIPLAGVSAVVVFATLLLCTAAALCYTPATATLTIAADGEGLHLGFASSLMNMAWAGGIVLGGAGGGGAAEAFGIAAPCIAIAILMCGTALAVGGSNRPGMREALDR